MLLDRILGILHNVGSLVTVFDSFQEGSLVLQPGKNVIEVQTRKTPVEVWLSLKNAGDMPVCHGDVDKISYTHAVNGFILYADVTSNVLQINWHVIFEEKNQ